METIFDHDVTKEELKWLYPPLNVKYLQETGVKITEEELKWLREEGSLKPLTREEYEKHRSSDSAYADIYRLYTHRNKSTKAKEILDKIKDPIYRFNTQLVDLE